MMLELYTTKHVQVKRSRPGPRDFVSRAALDSLGEIIAFGARRGLDWAFLVDDEYGSRPMDEKFSRRDVIGVAAGALASGVLAGEAASAREVAPDDKQAPEPTSSGKAESPYKFRLGAAEPRRYGASSIREHKLHDFPMSSTFSAGLIHIAEGGFREPHWHPNSDEWLFVMNGKIRMTIVDGKGQASRFECGPEDVAFTPIGFGHYVENIGEGEAYVMVVHNHADFTTVNLSEWAAGGKGSIFAATLNMPAEAFDEVPKKKVFIGTKHPK
jgi:oxalate decarboxylase/phosphoglucose isomerase-like protein (cupin superfamily)